MLVMSRSTQQSEKQNDKSIAYFKTLHSIVDWEHVLNESSANNAHNEFLRIFLAKGKN